MTVFIGTVGTIRIWPPDPVLVQALSTAAADSDEDIPPVLYMRMDARPEWMSPVTAAGITCKPGRGWISCGTMGSNAMVEAQGPSILKVPKNRLKPNKNQ